MQTDRQANITKTSSLLEAAWLAANGCILHDRLQTTITHTSSTGHDKESAVWTFGTRAANGKSADDLLREITMPKGEHLKDAEAWYLTYNSIQAWREIRAGRGKLCITSLPCGAHVITTRGHNVKGLTNIELAAMMGTARGVISPALAAILTTCGARPLWWRNCNDNLYIGFAQNGLYDACYGKLRNVENVLPDDTSMLALLSASCYNMHMLQQDGYKARENVVIRHKSLAIQLPKNANQDLITEVSRRAGL